MNRGNLLKQLRADHHVSQREMAQSLDVDASYLARVENDKPGNSASHEMIVNYCKVLGQDPNPVLFEAKRFPKTLADKILSDRIFFDFICMASKLEISDDLWQAMKGTLESFTTSKGIK